MFEASSDGDYRNLLLVTAQRHGLEAVEGLGGGGDTPYHQAAHEGLGSLQT